MKKHDIRILTLFIFIFLNKFSANSQNIAQFRPFLPNNFLVQDVQNNQLVNAFAGGVFAPQFYEMKLNNDNLQDLVVFDRADNTISTYLKKQNLAMEYYFEHAPKYEYLFPTMQDWLTVIDFDNDGKKDIFTSGNGKVRCFKNIGQNDFPLFRLINNDVKADYGFGSKFNIAIINGDIPAIIDVDNDGDIDILAFDTFASGRLNYYKNLSKEKYNVPDSLDFKVTQRCWGKFEEHISDNGIDLKLDNNCLASGLQHQKKQTPQHIGSTIFAFDPNKDGKKDLLLGDISFGNLVYLQNSPMPNLDSMIAIDTIFPKYNQKVNLRIFPAAFNIDFDNDGKQDLVVANNDTYGDGSRNQNLWLYKNQSATMQDSFKFVSNNYFLDKIIDFGYFAVPILTDISGDGNKDLLLSTMNNKRKAQLYYFQNTSTNNTPRYQLIDTNYLNLITQNIQFAIPTPTDFDGNGSTDLLIGEEKGKLLYFKNTATATQNATFVLQSTNFEGIDVGENAAPEAIDLDRNGTLDLIVGNREGILKYYVNAGSTTTPFLVLANDSLGRVKVNQPFYYTGYAVPRIADINNNGIYDLVVGSEMGKIWIYLDIESNLNGRFVLAATPTFFEEIGQFANINKNFGTRINPFIANLDADNLPDLLIGTYKGGILAYQNTTNLVGINEIKSKQIQPNISLYPNPTTQSFGLLLDNDMLPIRDLQLSITDLLGKNMNAQCQFLDKEIGVENLPKGIYFIQIKGRNINLNRKLIVH